MLAVKNQPNLDLGAHVPIGTMLGREVGAHRRSDGGHRVVLRSRALRKAARRSAASRARGGASSTGFFLSTNGGSVGEGQVFEYDPRDETLKVIYDAPNATDLDNPDNMTVTPRGGLLLCEDAAGNNFTEGERLVGLTLHGKTFTFAMNNMNLTHSTTTTRSRQATIASPSGRAPATAPTAAGSSSTFRRRE